MAAEAQAQAKQLDSVTDVVQDTELDASKVQQAMASVGGGAGGGGASAAAASSTFKVSKDHVKTIVDEFDGYFTEDQAEKMLRDVHVESKLDSGDELLKAALQKLLAR
eukprot:CAMPEP_0113469662 /NCGR_PEP_ID=MMETSP0014_2-20120614/16020_1 /TAXON_ID=2857 /ORGANISM="Nitzschia sp." /LENGTH=107 /DNA_ID=CAMNT_0000362157 /DNA_START=187 /DNA_END=510 /DNA_ORIENTATION=+ /assembly_acc=CAM_ASM_000159